MVRCTQVFILSHSSTATSYLLTTYLPTSLLSSRDLLRSIMIPNAPTPNLTDIAIQIRKIHAPPTLGPLHRPRHHHARATLLEPLFPRVHVLDARHGEAEVLFEMRCRFRLRGRGIGRIRGLVAATLRSQEGEDVLARSVARDHTLVIGQGAVGGGGAELEEEECGLAEGEDGHSWL